MQDDWKEKIREALDEMVEEMELPEKSLHLMKNYGRDKERITSYSVCIYEPDYPALPNAKKDPTRNSIVLNIKEKKNVLELLIGILQFGDIQKPDDIEWRQLKSDKVYMHVTMRADSPNLKKYIKENTRYALANYTSKATPFGCCSQFEKCSDEKHCVHENKLYSKACMYRGHLDAGRIFYGKNRNID